MEDGERNLVSVEQQSNLPDDFQWKLWIYSNYDCNLQCSYCVAESSPYTPPRPISLETVRRLVDEAVAQGFSCVYFTGGEPLILEDIYSMLSYSSRSLPTVLLTNAMLLDKNRLEKLCAVNNDQLVIQVSLDGGRAEHHDAYRGPGTWARTVAGIRTLQANGLHVRLSTTQTPVNSAHLGELCDFHLSLGIPEQDHFIRPLARRGFSTQGIEVSMDTLSPEITANVDGLYWHPLATDEDLLVSAKTFPLEKAVQKVRASLLLHEPGQGEPLKTFT
jgi:MoaA/NifB/PqqE/SkfB family radical SAM enzyme